MTGTLGGPDMTHRTCSVVEDGIPCPNKHKGHGFCSTHLRRLRNTGTTDAPVRRKAPPCSVVLEDGSVCGETHYGKGMCRYHFGQWRHHGDPLKRVRARRGSVDPWVAEVVAMGPTGECVLWPFAVDENGYGRLNEDGASRLASHVVLRRAKGEPPEPGMIALHAPHEVCGNTGCVAPWHLRWGTYKENSADMIEDDTVVQGERSTLSKLTAAEVRQIRSIKGWGTQKAIGELYGVTAGQISAIRRRKAWAWLD